MESSISLLTGPGSPTSGWAGYSSREGGGKLVIFLSFSFLTEKLLSMEKTKYSYFARGAFRELEYHGTHFTWNLPWRLILDLRTVKVSRPRCVIPPGPLFFWPRGGWERELCAAHLRQNGPHLLLWQGFRPESSEKNGWFLFLSFSGKKKKVHFANENEAPVTPQKGLCLIPPGGCLPCTVRGVTDHAFSPGVVYLAKWANHIYN